MHDVKRILVVSRMTSNCRKAVHDGISLAKKYGAELHVMHVMHNPFSLEGWNIPIPSLEEEYKKMIRKAKEELDTIIESDKTQGMSIRESVNEGEPTAEILKVVKKENIDLLVMLAHEEGRLEHFLFGRSNEEIIREMPCSILLVKMEQSQPSEY